MHAANYPLSATFGAVVGLSLGLTGGGGAIFAVPLLVYGLGLPAREAIAISLAAVGATSFVGFLRRWWLNEVEIRTGLVFALAGMIGAPVGTWVAGYIPDALLLLAFGGLMVAVAVRMWQQASTPNLPLADCAPDGELGDPTCQRDVSGTLILTSRCAVLLILVGVLTGTLSGLFGVGGGFVIVPALVLFSSMPIQRAVGTSLMVIALVSVSGIASRIVSGYSIPPEVTTPFVIGGMGGLFLGEQVGRRLSGPMLQKVFVIVILAVAVFIISRNLLT